MTSIATEKLAMSHRAYLVRETVISILINAALSAAFVFIMFGGVDPVPVRGLGGAVFDFLPQTFMISLMSTLVPSALTAKRLRTGSITALPASMHKLPKALLLRSVTVAVVTTIALGIAAAATFYVAGIGSLPFATLLVTKILYGALVALIVTPVVLNDALARPMARERILP